MRYQACMRCGSMELATPSVRDAVAVGGADLTAWACRRCGLTGPAVTFDNVEDYQSFREERAALYKPVAGGVVAQEERPSALEGFTPPEGMGEEAPRRGLVTSGLAALVGGLFLFSAALLLYTAFTSGGGALWVLAPSGLFALLLGVPFMAMARRRR